MTALVYVRCAVPRTDPIELVISDGPDLQVLEITDTVALFILASIATVLAARPVEPPPPTA